jgi:hypothetical protein
MPEPTPSLRTVPGTTFRYVEAPAAELAASLRAVQESELAPGFKAVVTRLVGETYARLGIAVRGWGALSYRRTFAQQYEALELGYSSAGPGESLHQFGLAIDVGFVGLRYLRPDGSMAVVTSDRGFDRELEKWQRDALYQARNAIWERRPFGRGPLFRIRFRDADGEPKLDTDPSHLQACNQFPSLYPDPVLSASRSLAALLERVSGMRWAALPQRRYACDLGLGGPLLDVGTAAELWAGRAAGAKLGASERAALKRAFEEAERRWIEWRPLDGEGQALPACAGAGTELR